MRLSRSSYSSHSVAFDFAARLPHASLAASLATRVQLRRFCENQQSSKTSDLGNIALHRQASAAGRASQATPLNKCEVKLFPFRCIRLKSHQSFTASNCSRNRFPCRGFTISTNEIIPRTHAPKFSRRLHRRIGFSLSSFSKSPRFSRNGGPGISNTGCHGDRRDRNPFASISRRCDSRSADWLCGFLPAVCRIIADNQWPCAFRACGGSRQRILETASIIEESIADDGISVRLVCRNSGPA